MKSIIFLGLIFLIFFNLHSQTFTNNTSYSIPDGNSTGIYSPINVSGIPPTAIIDNVTINITHTWVGDLVVILVDPLGWEHILVNRRGGSGDNFINTVFKNNATISITMGSAPFTGAYIPEEPLPTGLNPNGTWKLRVVDLVTTDVGTLNNWSITFKAPPCPTVGIHTHPTSGVTNLTCKDSIYILPNDSSVAGGAIYPTLYFEFRTHANAVKNAIKIFENGQVIYQEDYGQMDPNTVLTVYWPGPGANPNASYTIQVCNQDGTAPMEWMVYDGNGTIHGSGNTPSGCTTYGPWSPMGIFTWTISPNVSGLYSTPWGMAGFWPDECGPGTYTITYNWNNQGTGNYHCTGSASIVFTVTNPWNASWTNPGNVCASSGPINLSGYITGNTGGTFSGPGVSGNIFNPAGLSGNVNITYTVGNSNYCKAQQTNTINVIPLAIANAGPDATICAGSSYTITGASIGGSATGCFWTSSGTGLLQNANTLTPTYIPSQQDIQNGSVILTITTIGPCASASDQMVLTITQTANASFNYGSGTFCKTSTTNPIPSVVTQGGTFSASPSGIVINPTTGEINLAASNAGTYTITYTISGQCGSSYSQQITITEGFNAEFYYQSPVCNNSPNIFPQHISGTNGIYSSTPQGLVFVNTSTGEINVSASQPGTYTITNYIPASGGCAAATYQSTLVIEPAPQVNAGPDITVCSNNNVNISNASFGGSASSVTWTTSGSGYFSNPGSINTTYILSQSDIQNGMVTLTVTTNDPPNTCGAVSDQLLVYINQAATANAGQDVNVCGNNPVTLNGTVSGTSFFTWSSSGTGTFQNSTTLSPVYIPSNQDVSTGMVQIFLTANDPDGSGPCTSVVDTLVLNIIPLATINIGDDIVVCEGNQINLTATIGGSATSVLWTSSGTGIFTQPSSINTNYVPSQNDIQNGQIMIYATTNDPDGAGSCLPAKDSIFVTIIPKPIINSVDVQNVTSCSAPNGQIIINATSQFIPLQYSIDNGAHYSTVNTYSNLSANTYYIVVQNSMGCTSTTIATIVNVSGVQILSVNKTNPLCYGDCNGTITINATGGNNTYYLNNQSQGNNSTFMNLCAGTYNIMVVDQNECMAQTQVTLTNPPELFTSFSTSSIICNDDSTGFIDLSVVGGTPPYSYLWSNAKTTEDIYNIPFGTYYVTVFDANNCIIKDTIKVIGSSTININFHYDQATSELTLQILGGTPPYTFEWSNNSNLPSITIDQVGHYTVTVTDSYGCTNSATYIYDVDLLIPNFITPNNDGKNDRLQIKNIQFYKKVKIEIYDRWGNLLYYFNGKGTQYLNPEKQWDGKYNDKELPLGTYLIIVTIDESNTIIRNISIIR
ncbi:MAG: gliding motility-associated C-terminal domain-containing protein [Bacteroidales bacterium]|nr:gliding motility-associated C-terminal domain-containing protein [Bacteroidales bacterium]